MIYGPPHHKFVVNKKDVLIIFQLLPMLRFFILISALDPQEDLFLWSVQYGSLSYSTLTFNFNSSNLFVNMLSCKLLLLLLFWWIIWASIGRSCTRKQHFPTYIYHLYILYNTKIVKYTELHSTALQPKSGIGYKNNFRSIGITWITQPLPLLHAFVSRVRYFLI